MTSIAHSVRGQDLAVCVLSDSWSSRLNELQTWKAVPEILIPS